MDGHLEKLEGHPGVEVYDRDRHGRGARAKLADGGSHFLEAFAILLSAGDISISGYCTLLKFGARSGDGGRNTTVNVEWVNVEGANRKWSACQKAMPS
jgi:hypothetical protein